MKYLTLFYLLLATSVATAAEVVELRSKDGVSRQVLADSVSKDNLILEGVQFKGRFDEDSGIFYSDHYEKRKNTLLGKEKNYPLDRPTKGAWTANWEISSSTAGSTRLGGNARLEVAENKSIVVNSQPTHSEAYLSSFSEHSNKKTSETRVGKVLSVVPLMGSREAYGVVYGENMSLDRSVLLFEGQLLTPGEVELMINDRLVSKTAVEPGALSVYGIPTTTGSNSVRVLLRQKDGSLQEFTSNLIYAPTLLPEGENQKELQLAVDKSGKPIAYASYKKGISSSLTSGLSIGSVSGRSFLAGEVLKATPIGVLSFRTQSQDFKGKSLAVISLSNNFSSVSVGTQGGRKIASFNIGSNGVSVYGQKSLDSKESIIQASYSVPISKDLRTSFIVQKAQDMMGESSTYAGIGLSLQTMAGFSQIGFNRQLGSENFNLNFNNQSGLSAFATVDNYLVQKTADTDKFSYTVSTDNFGEKNNYFVRLAGSISGIGGTVMGASKPSSLQSASVVMKSSSPNPKYAIGGRLVDSSVIADVPLRFESQLSQDPATVPMDNDDAEFNKTITPAFAGTYVVDFK